MASVTIGASCTDPQNLALTSTIDWGDGVIQPSSAVNMHTYASLPSSMAYTIVLSTIDSSGNSGSASESVVVAPAVSIGPGTSTTVSTTLTNQSAITPPTLVTFICTSVTTVVNGVTVSNVLPSAYGIACAAPTVTTSSSPTPVSVTIQTSNSTLARMTPLPNSPGAFLALILPLPGFVLLGFGARSPVRRRRRQHFTALGTILILCFTLTSCGGGFTPIPVVGVTPSASYYLTITTVVVNPPPPTGFVQTSLIIPLAVR
jgi:hypothetical protein